MNNFDVIVCGGGTAGIAAAVAAARAGASTLLLERTDSIGGSIARAYVYPMMTFHASLEKQIVAGIPQEIVDLARKSNLTPGHVPDTIGCAATITPIEPFDFAACTIKLLETSGVQIALNYNIKNVTLAGKVVTGVEVAGPLGDEQLTAGIVIDATGNGDIAVLAGAGYDYGRAGDNKAQPMTQMFILAGVDFSLIRQYINTNPSEFVLSEKASKGVSSSDWLAVSGFFSLIRRAQIEEKKVLFRDRVLCFQMRGNRAAFNMTRVTGIDGTDPCSISVARKQLLAQVEECIYVLKKYIPGFAEARLESIAPEVGVRETRHIKGLYTLTGKDVVNGTKFDDGIACGAFPVDIHSPDGSEMKITKMLPGTYYNIPYRCLIPEGLDGILVTGRCISATHEASASARVTPTCMALGQAAGTAAALCITRDIHPSDIDIAVLKHALLAQGAIII